MSIELPESKRTQALDSLKRYYQEHMDEEIGDLRAVMLLDFFLKELAPTVYNRAVGDVQAVLAAQVQDLEGTCWEAEFGYWKR